MATKTCQYCGIEFNLNTSPANISRQKYCSTKCSSDSFKSIPSFIERMTNKLNERSLKQDNGCILYTGQNNGNYGQIEYKRKTYLVHRVAYYLAKGDIPKGYIICHSCDTPLCINPDHLWAGTYADNVNDMIAKHRQRYKQLKKIDDNQLRIISIEILSGAKQKEIAKKYGVSQSYVSLIKNGKRRKLG